MSGALNFAPPHLSAASLVSASFVAGWFSPVVRASSWVRAASSNDVPSDIPPTLWLQHPRKAWCETDPTRKSLSPREVSPWRVPRAQGLAALASPDSSAIRERAQLGVELRYVVLGVFLRCRSSAVSKAREPEQGRSSHQLACSWTNRRENSDRPGNDDLRRDSGFAECSLSADNPRDLAARAKPDWTYLLWTA